MSFSESRYMHRLQQLRDSFRYRLAHADALPQLTLLGIISGLLTSLVAIGFRLSIELPLGIWLPDGSESFEKLPLSLLFLLPLAGFTLLGVIGWFFLPEERSCGVSKVIDRLHHHQAKMTAKNLFFQFIGGVLVIISGAPLGREGPAVHLGAASASIMGQQFKLPNNSLRVLIGCGVAAAIAASFNTPLAGVIFAMEVVLMEYTIVGFIPIILAAVLGAVCSRLVFGVEPAFTIPPVTFSNLLEMPYFVLCGLAIGAAASLMLVLFSQVNRFAPKFFLLNCLLAGLLTGLLAMAFPQILGVGYDTVEDALLGNIAFFALLGIALCKLVGASVVAALGAPGGLIGPSLVIGACLGGALGLIGGELNPTGQGVSGFYAILGMGAMMGAVLNAPLAALIAVLELTYNPNILLPSMLVIVIACLTCRRITGLPGIFAINQDIGRYSSPVFQMLSRAGVTSIMTTRISPLPSTVSWENARQTLAQKPDWLVIDDPGETKYILRPVDLSRYLDSADKDLWEDEQEIELMDIPGERWQLKPIHPEASLQEAYVAMKKSNLKALFIRKPVSPIRSEVAGIITRETIDNYYQ